MQSLAITCAEVQEVEAEVVMMRMNAFTNWQSMEKEEETVYKVQ